MAGVARGWVFPLLRGEDKDGLWLGVSSLPPGWPPPSAAKTVSLQGDGVSAPGPRGSRSPVPVSAGRGGGSVSRVRCENLMGHRAVKPTHGPVPCGWALESSPPGLSTVTPRRRLPHGFLRRPLPGGVAILCGHLSGQLWFSVVACRSPQGLNQQFAL